MLTFDSISLDPSSPTWLGRKAGLAVYDLETGRRRHSLKATNRGWPFLAPPPQGSATPSGEPALLVAISWIGSAQGTKGL